MSEDWRVDGVTLYDVHDGVECAGRPCVIHNQSQHHMLDWTLNWRSDRGIFERMCPHGIGHPDPDNQEGYNSVHGCDGCCRPPTE